METREIVVQLKTVDDVKKFNQATFSVACNITLKSGRYIVDAKSLVGIFSLDLTKPIHVIIEELDNKKDFDAIADKFIEEISDLIIKS